MIFLRGMSQESRYGLQDSYFTKADIDIVLKEMKINPDDVEVDYDAIARDTIEAMDLDYTDYMKRVVSGEFREYEYLKPKT